MTAPPKVRPPAVTPPKVTPAAPRSQPVTEKVAAPRPVRWLPVPAQRRAPRTPFVLLIVGLLGCGLVGLLLLNTATASGSFRAQSLQQRNADLTLRQQALQREVGALDTPQALASAAAKLGMVPGSDPAFLVRQPGGSWKVMGSPTVATAPPTPSPAPKPKPKPKSHHAATPKSATHNKTHKKPTHPTASTHRSSHGGH